MSILDTIKSFVFTLTDEQAGLLLKAVCAYSDGVDMRGDIEDGTVRACIGLVKPTLDRDREIKENRRRCGRMGGAPRGNTNASKDNAESTEKQPKTSKNNQKQAKQAYGCFGKISLSEILDDDSQLIINKVIKGIAEENKQNNHMVDLVKKEIKKTKRTLPYNPYRRKRNKQRKRPPFTGPYKTGHS